MTCCPKHSMCAACKPDHFSKSVFRMSSSEWKKACLDVIEAEMIEARCAYYCQGEPIMSDSKYDKLEDIMREQRPDSIVIDAVGCVRCYKDT